MSAINNEYLTRPFSALALMNNIETLSQLLQLSDSQYRIYDIGRKIEKISKEHFEKVELNQVPYPTPSQGHAIIAITFWQKQSPQPYLWLLKLPLDERGLLNQGARNHFIAIVVEALGSDLTKDPTEQQQELLNSNPYLYTPAQYKLASLNSKIKTDLKQDPSEYLAPFITYLSGELGWQNWQAVGVQGITDFATRINQDNNNQLLILALANLPDEVLFPLCSALENEPLSIEIIDALLALLEQAMPDTSQLTKQQHLLRSLSANCQHPHVKALISGLLSQQTVAPELLITLSGRCWSALASTELMMQYFEHLVASDDSALFNSIFKDLVALPELRPIVFQCMRAPNRSTKLAQAIGQLFNQAQ